MQNFFLFWCFVWFIYSKTITNILHGLAFSSIYTSNKMNINKQTYLIISIRPKYFKIRNSAKVLLKILVRLFFFRCWYIIILFDWTFWKRWKFEIFFHTTKHRYQGYQNTTHTKLVQCCVFFWIVEMKLINTNMNVVFSIH